MSQRKIWSLSLPTTRIEDKRSLNELGLRGSGQSRFVTAMRMRTLLSLHLLLLATVALAHPDYSDSWEEFKLKYNKKYQTEEDEVRPPRVTELLTD